MTNEFIDPGARRGGLKGKNPIALGGYATQRRAERRRRPFVANNSCLTQASANRSVDWPSCFLTDNESDR
jgi:hypothetical protein